MSLRPSLLLVLVGCVTPEPGSTFNPTGSQPPTGTGITGPDGAYPELSFPGPAFECVTRREIGRASVPTSVPAEAHLLDLALVAPDRVEVRGAPDGATIELLGGDRGESCAPLAGGGCAWVDDVLGTATVTAGVATFVVDTSRGLGVQAHDPATGATSGLWLQGDPALYNPNDQVLEAVGTAGTYAGYRVVELLVWVEAGDHVAVSGVADSPDTTVSVYGPGIAISGGTDVLAAWQLEGDAAAAGWLHVGFASGWASEVANQSLTLGVTPSLRTWYADVDGDGHGDATAPVQGQYRPAGTAGDGADCHDADPGIFGGAGEICGDGVDSDCDGVDESCAVLGADLGPDTHGALVGAETVIPAGDVDGDGVEDVAIHTGRSIVFASAGQADLCAAPITGEVHAWIARALGDTDGSGIGTFLLDTEAGLRLVRGIPEGPPELAGIPVPGFLDDRGRGVADLTGDGLTDLVLEQNEGDIEIYASPYEVGDAPIATYTGSYIDPSPVPDLDGDGIGELAYDFGNELRILFGPHQGVQPIASAGAVVWTSTDGVAVYGAGDADGDGRADLVVGAPPGLHVITQISAAGAHDLAEIDLPPSDANDPTYIDVEDAAIVDGHLWIAGDGLYEVPGPLAGAYGLADLVRRDPGSTIGVDALHVRDFDGDGSDDLLATEPHGATWLLLDGQ